MRKIVLTLPAGKKNSDKIIIKKTENTLNIKGFDSKVKDLKIVFKYHNGKKKSVVMYETGINRNIENIGSFESFWFEFDSAESNFPVQLALK